MQHFPICIQSFGKLRRNNLVYIDKTALIRRLIDIPSCYFLNRPRRCGKSLIVSSLESLFLGQRELIKGSANDKDETVEWLPHPVLHLDLSAVQYEKAVDLEYHLNNCLSAWEQQYGVDASEQTSSARFVGCITYFIKQTNDSERDS